MSETPIRSYGDGSRRIPSTSSGGGGLTKMHDPYAASEAVGEPEVGHRLRVTQVYEGTVDLVDPGNWVRVRTDSGTSHTICVDNKDLTVERLPDPEPEWQPGDVVRDADENTVVVLPRRFSPGLMGQVIFHPTASGNVGEEMLLAEFRCPFTPLVRDGKPWAEAVQP